MTASHLIQVGDILRASYGVLGGPAAEKEVTVAWVSENGHRIRTTEGEAYQAPQLVATGRRAPDSDVPAGRRPAMTMAEINRALGIPKRDQTAELDGTEITGRQDLAARPTQRTWHCPDCSAHGTQPGHAGHCWRKYITTAVWASPAAHAAREALADYQAREAADTLSRSAAQVENDPNLHLGRISRLMAELLATIDTAAGA